MIKILEVSVMLNGMIAEEVLNNCGTEPEEIAKIVKARIDETEGGWEWLGCVPIEHIKNLVRKKMKENELMIYLVDLEGRDDKIREELRGIQQDIQKTRPNFFFVEIPLSIS